MNKRIRKKQNKIIGDKIIKLSDEIPHETVHINEHGAVINWNQLSKDMKDWVLHG